MDTESTPCCLACQSKYVLSGRLAGDRGGGASFRMDGTKVFTLALSGPDVTLPHEAYACLKCGLVWSALDEQSLLQTVETWGNHALKSQVESWRSKGDP